jgi:ribosomal protein S18 acetylase RimI-like enzyme
VTTPRPFSFRVEPLARQSGRETFDCGVEALDRYLRQQASQDAKRGYAAIYVALEAGRHAILGFCTLLMAGVLLDHLPADLQARMPRYPSVPAIRLGRLAVATEARGRGLGQFLLMDAMHRALENEVAWAAFIVDAEDEQARAFYLRCGFLALADDPNHLFLPRATVEAAFA